jgi:hypothetical protein
MHRLARLLLLALARDGPGRKRKSELSHFGGPCYGSVALEEPHTVLEIPLCVRGSRAGREHLRASDERLPLKRGRIRRECGTNGRLGEFACGWEVAALGEQDGVHGEHRDPPDRNELRC